ncbi:MAG: YqgE/AlgH family protein [Alphaproteobacteria bacterium]|nr:MAG: YqgE/AlgH family protein [Alphaproteobacteria bacterium]
MLAINNKILISTPRYSQKQNFVILIHKHDSFGSLGLSLNCTLPHDFLLNLVDSLDIPYFDPNLNTQAHYGGTHDLNQGTILHSSDYKTPSSIQISQDLHLTNSLSLLRKIAKNEGPKKSMIILGHTKFDAGQIEDELYENKWLVMEPSAELVFTDKIWDSALSLKGLKPESQIHNFTGHA